MNNNAYYQEQEDELQFGPLLKLCYRQFLNNWGWFLLSVIVCVLAGVVYWQSQPRIFQRQSVMLIEDADNGNSMRRMTRNSGMSSLMELNGISVGDNLQNEIFILSSKRLMLRVVDKLKLDVDYTTKEGLHPIALYGNERPFEVLFKNPYTGKKMQQIKVKRKDDQTVVLTEMLDKKGKEQPNVTAKLGQFVQTPYGPVCVVRGKSFAKWDDEVIAVSRLSHNNAANRYMREMSVEEYDKETSLIVITCQDMHVKRADDILNTLYDTYKNDVVQNKNRVAYSTAKFIDDRIALIGSELSQVENDLATFKKQNQLIDFEESSKFILNETSDARKLALEAETELNVARYLSDYLNNHTNDHDLIPALSLGANSYNSQVADYNKLMNQRNTTVQNSSDDHAVVREMDRQLVQMRNSIKSSIQSYIQSLQLRVRDAKQNEQFIAGKITNAPEQEKRGLDIKRQQVLKETLYTYLLNKREEVALKQAINEANVRLVEGPIGGDKKISPKGSIILPIAFLIGLFIPTLIIWLRMTLDVTVHGRKDVEDATSIPILGEIPRLKKSDKSTIISEYSSDAPIVEAFRILRFGLGYIKHSTQVMMTTSSTPGQGKSFVARNLAIILAMSGKKVVVVDADIRKGTLSASFGSHLGLTTYLADEHTRMEDIICHDMEGTGVDFISAGPMPPNPSELLMSNRLNLLVGDLRKQYDHIILDCTPMFSVADASIVNRLTDLTLFIIRVGLQDRDFLTDLDRMYKEERFKHLCVVLNDANAKYNTYGCGYGYGYGYGYGETKQSRTKKILSRLRK